MLRELIDKTKLIGNADDDDDAMSGSVEPAKPATVFKKT